MKFVDEATITVTGGGGGHGCLSFRRERFVAKGGPDGGDGDDGGSIYLRAKAGINTLADFRYTRAFKAERGADGGGRNCTGRSGKDLTIDVPVGTEVYDNNTDECIGDLTKEEQILLVAKGGFHGLGRKLDLSRTNTDEIKKNLFSIKAMMVDSLCLPSIISSFITAFLPLPFVFIEKAV